MKLGNIKSIEIFTDGTINFPCTIMKSNKQLIFYEKDIRNSLLFLKDKKKQPFQNMSQNYKSKYVKMLSIKRQSTCHFSRNLSGITRRWFSLKRNSNLIFNWWFTGFVDAEGWFGFYQRMTSDGIPTNSWKFEFGISQSTYNIEILYYIKNKLKIGEVYFHEKERDTAVYRISGKEKIIRYILPIFEECTLLTGKKYFAYKLFKDALKIYTNESYSQEYKTKLLLDLKKQVLPENFVSPAWKQINYVSQELEGVSKESIAKIMPKSWIIGFTEGEGSFYIAISSYDEVKNIRVPVRRVEFEIGQDAIDQIVLYGMRLILNGGRIYLKKGGNYKKYHITNVADIKYLIEYFKNVIVGRKSIEHAIWARAFRNRLKAKGGQPFLLKMSQKLRELRKYRPSASELEKRYNLKRNI